MVPSYAKDQPAGFTNRIQKVAIVGSGGQIGSIITDHLIKNGKHTLTAITRTGSSTKIPDGVQVSGVDYEDQDSIAAALKGQDLFFIALSTSAPPGTEERLIKAAAQAGVRWVIPTSFTSDLRNKPLGQENMHGVTVLNSIAAIEKAGVSSWTAFVTSYWYEYSLAMGTQFFGFDIANKKIEYIDDGETKINTTTWPQIARAVVALLSLKELPEDENDKSVTLSRWRNEPLYISSFTVSQRDILASLNRNLGTEDSDWEVKSEQHLERYNRGMKELQGGDMNGFATALYTRGFYPNGDGNYEAKYGVANEDLGLPKESLDEATKVSIDMVARGWNGFYNRN